jgi:hypothetical protein
MSSPRGVVKMSEKVDFPLCGTTGDHRRFGFVLEDLEHLSAGTHEPFEEALAADMAQDGFAHHGDEPFASRMTDIAFVSGHKNSHPTVMQVYTGIRRYRIYILFTKY